LGDDENLHRLCSRTLNVEARNPLLVFTLKCCCELSPIMALCDRAAVLPSARFRFIKILEGMWDESEDIAE